MKKRQKRVAATITIGIVLIALFIFSGCDYTLRDAIREKIAADEGQAPTDTVTFTVSYNGNDSDGGTVPTDSNSYEEGAVVTVAAAGTMTRAVYTFTGWNANSNGSGTDRAAGSTFTMGTADVILNAQWIEWDREMVSVLGISDNSYTQTDTSSNSFIHNISSFSIAKYEVTYELWYTVHSWALSNGYHFANPGREGHDGTVTDPAGPEADYTGMGSGSDRVLRGGSWISTAYNLQVGYRNFVSPDFEDFNIGFRLSRTP